MGKKLSSSKFVIFDSRKAIGTSSVEPCQRAATTVTEPNTTTNEPRSMPPLSTSTFDVYLPFLGPGFHFCFKFEDLGVPVSTLFALIQKKLNENQNFRQHHSGNRPIMPSNLISSYSLVREFFNTPLLPFSYLTDYFASESYVIVLIIAFPCTDVS